MLVEVRQYLSLMEDALRDGVVRNRGGEVRAV